MIAKNIFNKKIFLLILIIVLSFSLIACGTDTVNGNQALEETLSVHFIDIGQGDAVLIQDQVENKNMLIDGGDRWNWVAEKLTSYLREQDIETVHKIVATHPHADHIGGLPAVIEDFNVEQIYDSGHPHDTQTYINYLELIDEKDIPFSTPRRKDTIQLGELTFGVLHPAGDVEQYSLNDASLVLHLEYGEISFLFTGDAEYTAEREMVDSGQKIASEILKVGHHGSSTSTNDFFLQEVDPEIAVIQVGEDNRYGHPSDEVLAALKAREVEIYRNDIQGDIVVNTDGEDYWLDVEHDADPRAPPAEKEMSKTDRININTASVQKLQELHGIGPAYAENIIEYREAVGGFDGIEEITEVSGIGPATFKDIKEEITI